MLNTVARRAGKTALPRGQTAGCEGHSVSPKTFKPDPEMPVLSVIIPVYNEMDTIGRVLSQVAATLPKVPKQIVVVDDRSSDGTAQWLRRNIATGALFDSVTLGEDGNLDLCPGEVGNQPGVAFAVCFHSRNQGKGAAVRTGLAQASGDVIVIQDADLEYDPNDWARMLPLITERKVADVVYGSRFAGEAHRALYFHHYMGNRLISFFSTYCIIKCFPISKFATKCLRATS